MSGREWKPGDVAMVRGDVCLRMENRLWEHGRGDRFAYHAVEDEPHPLVVIDPEDHEQVERLAKAYADLYDEHAPLRALPVERMQAALREFANPRPPRIAEPGVWGVVEAACCHSDERRKWVHHEDGNWWPAESYGAATARAADGRDPRLPDGWDDLINPTLIREGVTS